MKKIRFNTFKFFLAIHKKNYRKNVLNQQPMTIAPNKFKYKHKYKYKHKAKSKYKPKRNFFNLFKLSRNLFKHKRKLKKNINRFQFKIPIFLFQHLLEENIAIN